MPAQKSISQKTAHNGGIGGLTLWKVVRAACVANLLVGALVVAHFYLIALVEEDYKEFSLGLSLLRLVTLIIWCTSALLYVMALIFRSLQNFGRWLIGAHRSLQSGTSVIWDDSLDGSELHRS